MRSLFASLHRRYGRRIISRAERQAHVNIKIDRQKRLLASTHKAAATTQRAQVRPRVAIVGAGFAGLMAGYTLMRRFDVTIFEARDRVGGRVWSKAKSSGIVEAGGELIGYNHPLWLCLARDFELGLSLITSDPNFDALHLEMPVYLDGTRVPGNKLEKLYDDIDTTLQKMTNQAKHVRPDRPWKAHRAKYWDDMSLSEWIANQNCRPLVDAAIRQQFSNDGGVPCEEQSYLANLATVAGGALPDDPGAFFSQSETLRCSSGNQALADRLAQEIRSQDGVIHQLAPVNAIRIEPDKVVIEADGRSPETADYVVLAIPPSLWPGERFARLEITPSLPRDYYVSMGKAVKYLSPMKERFWIGKGLAPTATSSAFGVTWEGTDNQIAAVGRDVELSLFAGAQAAGRALEEWTAGGSRAVDAFYSKRIGSIYKGYGAHLSQQPEFVAWPEDPWTGAGYSCLAPGEVCRAGPLYEKGFQRRMFFAGEHTCFAYMGYMEGALQSGQRAGAAIIKANARFAKKRRSVSRR